MRLFDKLRALFQRPVHDKYDPYSDPVTHGDNYTKFKTKAAALLKKNPAKQYVIFYSDIKNFKYINDVYGFEIGDKVLRRYYEFVSSGDKKLAVARISADNFVSMEEYTDQTYADIIPECHRRIGRVSDVSDVIKGMPQITVFVGAYCTGNDHTLTIDAMIDRANLAQRQLKSRQTSGCILYCEDFRLDMLAEQDMENRMRPALECGEFVVYLQPKMDISSDCVVAAEALVRWQDPQNGLIPPLNFIPLFERNGFIQELDTYVFEQVCRLLRKWIDEGAQPLPVSVNVSKVQLSNQNFLTDYIGLKERYQIPDGLIEIEFTESMLFDNSERMTEILLYFKAHGCRSSIDDFGAGYSSLNLLKNLPADILKLDKMFFDENEYKDREKIIIQNVISMAKGLNMQTVAEGVERMEQVHFLKSVQCDLIQGYIFDKPLPITDFERKYIAAKALLGVD